MSADFEPVKLGPSRRRFDPVLIGVVAVVVALGVAIVKPWDPGPSARAAAPTADAGSQAPAAVASAEPIASVAPKPATPPPGEAGVADRPPTWSDLKPIVTPYDAWGVRVIMPGSNGLSLTSYRERWSPATATADGGALTFVGRDTHSIVVLGVTAPRNEDAEDARIWKVHSGGQLEWVNADQILSGDVNGSLLYVRPGVDGSPYGTWDSGEYRVDVLVRDGIRRLSFAVPDADGTIPPLDEMPPTPIPAVGAVATDPSDVVPGAFATTDGMAVSLDTDGYRPLGEFETWHDMVWYGGPHVASVFLPRASGLGVMLAPGSYIQSASIARIAPAVRGFAPPSADAGVTEHVPRASYVVFPAPDGGTWRPGVYAISVSWAGEGGRVDRTWHVELRPGQG